MQEAYDLLIKNLLQRRDLSHQVGATFVIEAGYPFNQILFINDNKELNRQIADAFTTGEGFPDLPEGYFMYASMFRMVDRGLIPLDK